MSYKAVIFDLFGTLVGIFHLTDYRRALAGMAAAAGAPLADFTRLWEGETAHARMTGTLPSVAANIEYICRSLSLPRDPAGLAEAVRLRREFYRATLAPRPDAVPTLARLKEAGLRIGLVSNCSAEAPELWPENPLAPLIDAPVFSAVEGRRKPDPHLYRMVCERLSVQPRDCLYVGDGDYGELAGAERAGMHAVLIRAEDENEASYRVHPEEWDGPRIGSLTEILALVGIVNCATKKSWS